MIHDFATLPRQPLPVEPPRPVRRSEHRKGWFVLGLLVAGIVSVSLSAIGTESADSTTQSHTGLDSEPEIVEPTETFSAESTPAQVVVRVATKPVEAARSVANETSAPESVAVSEDTPVRWAFYDRLPESWPIPTQKGVYVDADVGLRERPIYELQAASFRQWSDAERLKSALAAKGLKAKIHSRTNQMGTDWHQVVVGPFDHNSTLNKAQDVLVSLNLMPLKRRVN